MENLLNVSQAAEALQVSQCTVWRRIYDGSLKVCHIGRLVRIRPEDLNKYIDRQTDEKA